MCKVATRSLRLLTYFDLITIDGMNSYSLVTFATGLGWGPGSLPNCFMSQSLSLSQYKDEAA